MPCQSWGKNKKPAGRGYGLTGCGTIVATIKENDKVMEKKVLEEYTYYRIESPRGVMSDAMTENEVKYNQERGYFTLFLWRGDAKEAYAINKYKIGKIHKYVRKTTLTEEVVA